MPLNKDLLVYARQRHGLMEKAAIVPSDAAAGGAPPPAPGGDPAGGGGPPPGMNPAPAPQPDPSAAAGAGGGMDSTGLQAMIQQSVQNAMNQGAQGQTPGAQGPGMKPMKPDINMVATDVFQLKKMMFSVFKSMGMEMPPDLLDGPGRDPQNGMPAATAQTGSTPAGAGSPQGQPPANNAVASAIQPVEPMQGAFPQGGAGGGAPAPAPGGAKAASIGRPWHRGSSTADHARAVAALFKKRQEAVLTS